MRIRCEGVGVPVGTGLEVGDTIGTVVSVGVNVDVTVGVSVTSFVGVTVGVTVLVGVAVCGSGGLIFLTGTKSTRCASAAGYSRIPGTKSSAGS